MGEHRPHMRPRSVHRDAGHRDRDPAHSSDPRVRELVSKLHALPVAPPPQAHFRAELRSQLVAVAPRLVEEGEPATSRPSPGPQAPGVRTMLVRLRRVRLPRPVGIGLGILCVFLLLLGGAVWMSTTALPGDALYTVKRVSENARLALAGSDTERAKDYLSFAATRAEEVADLLDQPTASALAGGNHAAAGISAHTAKLVDSTLDSADKDVRKASQLLGGTAVRDRSASPLSIMIDWAPKQLIRLKAITHRLPNGPVHQRVTASAQTVSTAAERARALRADLGCACLSTAHKDRFGPLPCTTCAPGSAPVPHQQRPSTSPASPPATHRPAPAAPSTNPAPGRTPGAGSRTPEPPARSGTHAPAPLPASSPSTRAHGQAPGAAPDTGPAGSSTAPTSRPAAPTDPTDPAPTRATQPDPDSPEPTVTLPSPDPSRTCLIVLLGLCL